ncbi:hypothetical protein H312_03289 [Anncaliia algerae PRA339]|uniref:Uncharacterized protein n=1 Tax=Anncaliia algerae PRA339 TaxID=1288291 RepID=A0A059EX65_9MICR|nr:hypothetical protein H312_03289 [Anncaliia algerae PRA339]
MVITHRNLVLKTQTQGSTIAWLQEIHVIPINKECLSCSNYQIILVPYKKAFRWQCTLCSEAVSIFEKTSLLNTNMEYPSCLI